MKHVWAGAAAVACGLAAGFCIIWFGLDAPAGGYATGWAFLYVILSVPILTPLLAGGLVALEAIAAKLKWPRALVIGSGVFVLPLALIVVLGFMPLVARLALGPNHGDLTTPLVVGAFAVIPCAVSCLVYVALARSAPH